MLIPSAIVGWASPAALPIKKIPSSNRFLIPGLMGPVESQSSLSLAPDMTPPNLGDETTARLLQSDDRPRLPHSRACPRRATQQQGVERVAPQSPPPTGVRTFGARHRRGYRRTF